jgi:hypothetical protein
MAPPQAWLWCMFSFGWLLGTSVSLAVLCVTRAVFEVAEDRAITRRIREEGQ